MALSLGAPHRDGCAFVCATEKAVCAQGTRVVVVPTHWRQCCGIYVTVFIELSQRSGSCIDCNTEAEDSYHTIHQHELLATATSTTYFSGAIYIGRNILDGSVLLFGYMRAAHDRIFTIT